MKHKSQLRRLQASIAKRQSATSSRWGTPINYTHLSDAELDFRLAVLTANLPECADLSGMSIADLIAEYQRLCL
jgi:hypothetical protein